MARNQTKDVPDPGFEPQEHSVRMRQTSVDTFDVIKSEGLLSKMRLLVYEVLYHHGPMTGAEVDLALRGYGRGHYHKRLSELRRVRVVEPVGRRQCTVTGRMAIEWDVTDGLPIEQPKPVPNPAGEDIGDTLNLMRGYYRETRDKTGTALPESFVRVMRWLASMVPSKEIG